tara:strand:- start:787 stop:1068 length:282 start_codon:yes stop_codon:yes gene_type:complete
VNTTKATLFPTSIAPKNSDGLSNNWPRMLPLRDPLLRLISTLSLFADTKAISLPEKKADKAKNNKIKKNNIEYFDEAKIGFQKIELNDEIVGK